MKGEKDLLFFFTDVTLVALKLIQNLLDYTINRLLRSSLLKKRSINTNNVLSKNYFSFKNIVLTTRNIIF